MMPGTGSDHNVTTVKVISIIREPRPECIVNVPHADLLYWNKVTYTTAIIEQSEDNLETLGGTVFTRVDPPSPSPSVSFSVSGEAAITRFVTYKTPQPVWIGDYTTSEWILTWTGETETSTVSANTVTGTQTFPPMTLVGSGITTTVGSRTETSTDTETGGVGYFTRTPGTETNFITSYYFSTPSFAGPTDIMQPEVTYNGVTYAYIATAATAYIFFSILEIERNSSTSTISVPVPHFSTYAGNPSVDWAGNSTVTGALPSDLVGQLANLQSHNLSRCVLGTYKGLVTMDVAVSWISQLVSGITAHVSVAELGPPSSSSKASSPVIHGSTQESGSISGDSPVSGTVSPQGSSSPSPNNGPESRQPASASTHPEISPTASRDTHPGDTLPAPTTMSSALQTSEKQMISQASIFLTASTGLGGWIMSFLSLTQTSNTPGFVSTSQAFQGSEKQIISQFFTLPTSSTGLGGLILSALGATKASNPKNTVVSVDLAVNSTANFPAASTISALRSASMVISSDNLITAITPRPNAATISSTVVSMMSNGAYLTVNDQTSALSAVVPWSLLTAAHHQAQIESNGNIILSIKGSATTIPATVTFLPYGAGLLVGSKTVSLSIGKASSLSTVGGQYGTIPIEVSLTANSLSSILIGGSTLTANSKTQFVVAG